MSSRKHKKERKERDKDRLDHLEENLLDETSLTSETLKEHKSSKKSDKKKKHKKRHREQQAHDEEQLAQEEFEKEVILEQETPDMTLTPSSNDFQSVGIKSDAEKSFKSQSSKKKDKKRKKNRKKVEDEDNYEEDLKQFAQEREAVQSDKTVSENIERNTGTRQSNRSNQVSINAGSKSKKQKVVVDDEFQDDNLDQTEQNISEDEQMDYEEAPSPQKKRGRKPGRPAKKGSTLKSSKTLSKSSKTKTIEESCNSEDFMDGAQEESEAEQEQDEDEDEEEIIDYNVKTSQKSSSKNKQKKLNQKKQAQKQKQNLQIDIDIEKDIEDDDNEQEEYDEENESSQTKNLKTTSQPKPKSSGQKGGKSSTKAEMERERTILQSAKSKHPFLHQLYQEKQQISFKSPQYLEKMYLQNLKKTTPHQYKNVRQILMNLDNAPEKEDPRDPLPSYNLSLGSYMSIESPPTKKFVRKDCDFTGFPSRYRHKTAGYAVIHSGIGQLGMILSNGLRYSEWMQYQQIDKMQNNKIEEILSSRKNILIPAK